MKTFLSCIICGCHGFIAMHAHQIGDTPILVAAVVSYIAFITYREVTE